MSPCLCLEESWKSTVPTNNNYRTHSNITLQHWHKIDRPVVIVVRKEKGKRERERERERERGTAVMYFLGYVCSLAAFGM